MANARWRSADVPGLSYCARVRWPNGARDGGVNWTELSSPPHDPGQLSFNNVITVGPYNSDEVYIGQIAFYQSLDGGRKGGLNDYSAHPPLTTNSWTVLGCCQSLPNPFRHGLDMHGDIHDIVFAPYGSFVPDPSQIQIVFVANDGGITRGRFDSNVVVTWEPFPRGSPSASRKRSASTRMMLP
jgi:hypothetical protein